MRGLRLSPGIVSGAIVMAIALLTFTQGLCAESSAAPAASPAAQATVASDAGAATSGVKGYTLPPEKYRKAIAFARAGYRLYFAQAFYGALIVLGILTMRVGPMFRDLAERLSRRRFLQAVVFVAILTVAITVLTLPLSIYEHWLSRHYDQSIQGWPSWSWDLTKSQLIGVVLSSITVWILYGIIRRSPRRWWFYFWLATLPLTVFMIVVTPLVIDPLFFKFTALMPKHPELAAELEKVVERGGLNIPQQRMFEVNASSKMNTLNAYVTGFGPSKRIVVFDTTIAKMSTPEILFVFGHEMGHYVLRHILKGMILAAGFMLLGAWLAYLWLDFALAHWGSSWKIRGGDDWASLPALMVFVSVGGFLSSPLVNGVSRYFEHQADTYGLEVIHSIVPNPSENAAQAFQVLGYSHPPLNDRIVFARNYDPWSKGERPQFVP